MAEKYRDSIFDDMADVATLSELIEKCKDSHFDKQSNIMVGCESLLLDYLEVITGVEIDKVWRLSKMIQRRCVSILSVADILSILDISSRKSMQGFFNKMEVVGVLVLEYPEGKNNKYSDRRRIVFNPWLFWKGCYKKRRVYRKEWNKKRGIPL